MRLALFTSLLALAIGPTAAVAQLPPLPPTPTLPPLTVPLPTPAPAPAPTLPPVPAPTAAPTAPAVVPPTAQPTPSETAAPSQAGPSAGATSPGRPSAPTASKRRPSVVLAFRAQGSGRVAIRLHQIAPVCRNAGRLLVPARSGPNRFRFNGRIAGRPLRDGTYVATTPSGRVRFAIVRGKPTRNTMRLAPSVCDSGVLLGVSAQAGLPAPTSRPERTAAAPTANVDRGATDEPGPLPQVLGTAFTEAVEAAATLHPAFYVLLGLAMVALAAAAMPARAYPVASAGAALARHRAAVTLAGTLGLLFVIVVYWATLL